MVARLDLDRMQASRFIRATQMQQVPPGIDLLEIERCETDKPTIQIYVGGLALCADTEPAERPMIHLSLHVPIEPDVLWSELRETGLEGREGSDTLLHDFDCVGHLVPALCAQGEGEIHVCTKERLRPLSFLFQRLDSPM